MRIAIILLSLCLAGSLLFGYTQHQKAARWTGINWDYEFDPIRNITISRLKSNGRLLDVGYDSNSDMETDSLVAYAANGKISSILVDEDFNGIYEIFYTFDPNGVLVAKHEDIGQDGYFNEYTRYTLDSTFLYRDTNGDLWFEDHELIRKFAR